ncbi:MAG: zinc ABC transporter substrate-binding protein [Planctomycetaceae bacterium]|nr:zinc ABC transporter substrate-binding protein [Planctomycetaceae bacterium]
MALLLLSVAACQDGRSSQQPSLTDGAANGRVRLVATTNLVGDLVRRIAPASFEIKVLMGPGVDPHLYTPTRNDVRELLSADLVFYHGLNLEGRMARQLAQLKQSGRQLAAVTDILPRGQLRSIGTGHGEFDPHVWMSVPLWTECAKHVAKVLAERFPEQAAEIRSRSENLVNEFAHCDQEIREQLKRIPEERRVLVTAHDAFEYFGHDYGMRVRSVQGVSTESEAGVKDISDLVTFLVEQKIPAIFVESSVNRRYIEAVQSGVAARGGSVRIGDELYSDSLGPADGPAGTYESMMRSNLGSIVRALGDNAESVPRN